jgi:hypothetical protein
MTQKNSNNKNYKSISTGQPCSAAQYIAELICIRKAERENKGSLGYKFWNNGENYKTQIRVANKLIKKYGEKAVLHYLNSPSGSNIYSLGFLHKSKKFVLTLNFVEDGIAKSKTIVEAEEKKVKKVVEKPKGEFKSRKPPTKKNNLLSKLRKADGKK